MLIGKTFSAKSLANLNSYTKLLIHSNSSDGNTTFTDSSDSGHTITPAGAAAHDTAQYNFGATSMLFTSSGDDYLSIPDHVNFYLDGAFTIDCWARWSANGGIIFIEQYALTGDSWYFSYNTELRFYIRNGASFETLAVAWVPTADTWYHIALIRIATDLLFYVNGRLVGTQTPTLAIANSAHDVKIGRSSVNVWLDEFRLVKGKAMWTGQFVPPKGAYN